MGWSIKRPTLRTRDDERTKAAELTLRQSIYPLFLVTILFFLWGFSYGLIDTLNKHFQVTLNITRARSSSPSSLLRRIPACLVGPRKLAPAALGLQGRFHLGAIFVWSGLFVGLAVPRISQFWRILCSHFCDWKWSGKFGDGGEPLSCCLRTSSLLGDQDQHRSSVQWYWNGGCACAGELCILCEYRNG